MPPRLPTRVLTALPLTNGAAASSSTLPPPPRQSSPRTQSRGLHTAATRPARSRSLSWNQEHKRSFHSSSPREARQKDPYDVLGVKKDAKASDIKKAYYQLAKKWHPDSNQEKGAQERFVEIQSAYDILSDESKRQAYDQYGSASTEEGFDPNFARGGGGFGGFQDFGGFGGRAGNAGDLFESLFGGAFGGGGGFGGAGARARPMRGDDIEVSTTISFLEMCTGVVRRITIAPVVTCKPCSGSGVKPGQKKTQCATCRGTGEQTFQVQGMFMSSTCRACGGEGSSIPRGAQCGDCNGVGRVKEKREVEVAIPAGVEDGMKVKAFGRGDQPLSGNGPSGDLLIRVNVTPSKDFRRQGTNVYHEAKVPLQTALLGGRVRIPTLEGEVDVRVKAGTQYGEEAVMKGRGVNTVQGLSRARGDLVISWKVQTPRSLSPFQRKLMQAFADDLEGKPTNVYFGQPSSETPTSSTSTTTPEQDSKGTARTSFSSSSSSPSSEYRAPPHPSFTSARAKSDYAPPEVEPEYRRRDEPTEPAEAHDSGVLGKVASAIGGVLGFADRLFGKRKSVNTSSTATPTEESTPDAQTASAAAAEEGTKGKSNGLDKTETATKDASAPESTADAAERELGASSSDKDAEKEGSATAETNGEHEQDNKRATG